MLFIVSGRDKQNSLKQRLAIRPRHRAHYESLREDLILSGPYLDEKGDPIGSMIVMRRPRQTEAEEFARADPFYVEGVFETLTVWRWDWFMKRPNDLTS